ncbi:MAG: 30S ribosomal protein S13 [Candidatus Aenigmatarchaeota archaeon]
MVKEKKKFEKKPEVKKVEEGVRGIVRFAEADLDGTKKIRVSLLKVKGIGQSLAISLPRAAGIDPEAITGKLTDEQVKRMEEILKSLTRAGIPGFMLNRRTDPETGEDRHITSSDLTLRRKFDIDFLRKIRCYKGIRHEQGLPVRGQRTRGSFRTGVRVGVQKKALKRKKE